MIIRITPAGYNRTVGRRLRVHQDFPVERHLRDTRVLRIYEGASEIHRLIVSRHLLGKEFETTASGGDS
jgi:alkylation response protein AidB-like acyl-CoA dehydrogenase